MLLSEKSKAYIPDVNFCWGLKRKYAEEAYEKSTDVIWEHRLCTGRDWYGEYYGFTPFPTRCRDPVAPLIIITGKEDNGLTPFFLKSDSFVSGDLTISQAVETGLFQVS